MADSISDEAIAQFTTVTGAPSRQAQQYLAAHGGDVEAAVQSYYLAQEDNVEDNEDDPDYSDDDEPSTTAPPPPRPSGGGRRLGEGPSDSDPAAATSSTPVVKPKPKSQPQKKFATLGDFNSGGNDEDDDDDDDGKQDLFAGGEKSALAVQNPDDLKKRILEKAAKRGPPAKDAPKSKNHFTGSARTLGGDDTPSEEIAAPPQPAQGPERVDRVLHFWRDGFSVDDGDLYRNDDPRNAELLRLIQAGRAPLRIMNVHPGQEVDVELKQHDENYVKPKAKYKPFGGSGNRLGSPTPGFQTMPGSFEAAVEPTQPAAQASSGPPASNVDDSQPTVTLRVSLGSGTRLTSRFNTSQTIGDVYDFVRRAELGGREFVLQTTFPTIELKDTAQVIGEMAEFKRGGAVVQRYI